MSTSALASSIEYLMECNSGCVRLHAARSLGCPRRFGPLQNLREDAEKDMFARDVRELFLVSYAQALRTGRLRGRASGVLGRVLSSNASVAIDALLARGCFEPSKALEFVLDEILSRAHRRGFFYEPYQEREARTRSQASERCFVHATAVCARYLLAFGRGRDPRVRAAFDWLVEMQGADGTWRAPRGASCEDRTESYVLTRAVAQAFAELPIATARRYNATRDHLAAGWSDRVLVRCESPDAVMTELNIAPDPRDPADGPLVPQALEDRILYFPLEDLWLALAVGASPDHPHLAPWVQWLEDTQLADGSWRLQNPGLRERLLLSDPNGRLRAEALYLTDEWITLRGAQILYFVGKWRARAPEKIPA